MSLRNIYKEIAKENGTSVREVKAEMRKALETGFQNTDPEVQDNWRQIPRKGRKQPEIEDVIMYIIKSMQTDS